MMGRHTGTCSLVQGRGQYASRKEGPKAILDPGWLRLVKWGLTNCWQQVPAQSSGPCTGWASLSFQMESPKKKKKKNKQKKTTEKKIKKKMESPVSGKQR